MALSASSFALATRPALAADCLVIGFGFTRHDPVPRSRKGRPYGKGRLNFKIVIVNRQRSTPQALVHIQGSSQQQWYDITRWIGRGRNVESIDIGSINITANDKLQVIANSSSSSSSSSSSGAAAAPVPDYVWDYATKTLTINANVGENQFRDRTDIIIREVIIKDSVTTIGDGAFCGCSSLASVAFPDALQTIGRGAFCGCSSLASVAFPDALQTIGEVHSMGAVVWPRWPFRMRCRPSERVHSMGAVVWPRWPFRMRCRPSERCIPRVQ